MTVPLTATFEVHERGAVRPPLGGQMEMLAVPRHVARQVTVMQVLHHGYYVRPRGHRGSVTGDVVVFFFLPTGLR